MMMMIIVMMMTMMMMMMMAMTIMMTLQAPPGSGDQANCNTRVVKITKHNEPLGATVCKMTLLIN